MARTRTLLLLRGDVRERADMVGSLFIGDPALTEAINSSIADLQDLLIASFGDEYFETEASAATVAGTATVALPGTFYKLTGLFWEASAGTWQEIYKYTPIDARLDPLMGWAYGSPVRYRLQAGNLRFVPTPSAVHNLKIHHVPAPVRLSADGDLFDGYGGWEEWVIWDAAIKCLVKEESDVSVHMAERNRIGARIRTLANRDHHEPPRVQRKRHPRGLSWPWES